MKATILQEVIPVNNITAKMLRQAKWSSRLTSELAKETDRGK